MPALRLLPVLVLAACAGPASVHDAPTLYVRPGSGPRIELVSIAPGPGVERGFLIGRFELTREQYGAFVAAARYDGSDRPSSKPTEQFLADWEQGRWPAGTAHLPVNYVNLHHARAFCAWASSVTGRVVRLPTAAEWELAARGTTGRVYPWGETWEPDRCNWGDARDGRFGAYDGFPGMAPVGSFPAGATPDGVHDLAGNAWEWTADGCLRGGPWCLGPENQRTDRIGREDRDRCDDKFGFRVVVETAPPSGR